MATEEEVLAALRQVEDPDLHRDIVSLGFIVDLKMTDGRVDLRIVLTTPACPVREQMKAQVHDDGCSFEGSVPYHRLSLELFTLAQVMTMGSAIDLGSAFRSRLHQMFRVANAYCSERGRAPQIGDNDSGRALPLSERESLDHGYLAPLGATLFRDPELKRPGATVPDEAAWLLGASALADFARMGCRAPPRCFSSPRGGVHIIRGTGALLAVSAGPHGQNGIGGHSHNDKLSFELHLEGRPLIVDSGTATYLRNLQQRNAFRSTRAHNTIEVDGQEQSPLDPLRPFALREVTHARVEEVELSPSQIRLVANHSGYRSLVPPVRIRRTFLLDEAPRVLRVTDWLLGSGSHRAVGRLHLPDSQARLRAATAQELDRAHSVGRSDPAAFGAMCVELGPARSPCGVVLFESGLRLESGQSLYSPSYGEIQPASVLVYSLEGELPLSLTLVVLFC